MAECFRAYPCSVCISHPVRPSSCRVRPLLGWRCVPHPTKVSQRDTASGQFHELSSVPTCSEPERRVTRTRRVVAVSSLIHYIAQSVASYRSWHARQNASADTRASVEGLHKNTSKLPSRYDPIMMPNVKGRRHWRYTLDGCHSRSVVTEVIARVRTGTMVAMLLFPR